MRGSRSSPVAAICSSTVVCPGIAGGAGAGVSASASADSARFVGAGGLSGISSRSTSTNVSRALGALLPSVWIVGVTAPSVGVPSPSPAGDSSTCGSSRLLELASSVTLTSRRPAIAAV